MKDSDEKREEHLNLNVSQSVLHWVKDLKIAENVNNRIKQYAKENNLDPGESIFLPNEVEDEFELNSDEGYHEEDDDLNDFNLPFIPEEDDAESSLNFIERKESYSDGGMHQAKNLTKKNVEFVKVTEAEDLDKILFVSDKDLNKQGHILNIIIQTELKVLEENNENEEIEIIKDRLLLIILKYLHAELHSGLIELSDNFVEQRRFYLEKDQEIYLSIINLFLKKKEEFFLGVLSSIMSRLNISQQVLDNTFHFYMNVADQSSSLVQQIKIAFDKVYSAGIKT